MVDLRKRYRYLAKVSARQQTELFLVAHQRDVSPSSSIHRARPLGGLDGAHFVTLAGVPSGSCPEELPSGERFSLDS